MDVQNIEKLNQLISRSDMTGNEKVKWLIAFTENYQALQLLQPAVITSVYECKVCGKPYGDKLSLYEHYDSKHNKETEL